MRFYEGSWHRKFAFLPTMIGSIRVWLEFYERKLDYIGTIYATKFYKYRLINK